MRNFQSFIQLCVIKLNRYFDHLFRIITGLPTLSRSEITPSIYLGGQYGVRALDKLTKYQVTGIVNMRQSPIPFQVEKKGFKTLHLATPDRHAPTIENLLKGIEFIDREIKNGGKVYIHCFLGEGRGPSMVIAYLMSTGLTYEDAHAHIKAIRTFIDITPPQKAQLKKLEEILQKQQVKS